MIGMTWGKGTLKHRLRIDALYSVNGPIGSIIEFMTEDANHQSQAFGSLAIIYDVGSPK